MKLQNPKHNHATEGRWLSLVHSAGHKPISCYMTNTSLHGIENHTCNLLYFSYKADPRIRSSFIKFDNESSQI